MADGNQKRIVSELIKAVSSLEERYPGYHNALARVAVECIIDTTEHVERRLNINQRFDTRISNIAQQAIDANEEATHD